MREERFIDSAIRKALGRQESGAASSCPDENLLAAYLEHSLSGQERSRLESHVSDCVSCRELLALSMKAAGDEQAPTGETGRSRERKLLFRFSVPLAAAAALALGIGMATLFLLTREVRKPEQTEVAQQMPPAAAPASGPMLQAQRESSAAPPAEPTKPATPGPPPARAARAQVAADEMTRVKDKQIRTQEQPAPQGFVHSTESERKLSVADGVALNDAANEPAEWKSESQAGTATAQAGGEAGAGRVAGGPVGGVVGGILAPARPVEEPAAKEAAPQAAAVTTDSGGGRTDGLGRVPRLAAKSQRAALSAASAPAAESRLRDAIRGVAADEKAGKRPDSATRVIGGRTFELYGGFWVDLKCIENPDAELIDLSPGSPELDQVRKAVPGLDELRRNGLPILLDWNGRICVVR